jgi:hypothetical protein
MYRTHARVAVIFFAKLRQMRVRSRIGITYHRQIRVLTAKLGGE